MVIGVKATGALRAFHERHSQLLVKRDAHDDILAGDAAEFIERAKIRYLRQMLEHFLARNGIEFAA
jgi:hypothetical protein